MSNHKIRSVLSYISVLNYAIIHHWLTVNNWSVCQR